MALDDSAVWARGPADFDPGNVSSTSSSAPREKAAGRLIGAVGWMAFGLFNDIESFIGQGGVYRSFKATSKQWIPSETAT